MFRPMHASVCNEAACIYMSSLLQCHLLFKQYGTLHEFSDLSTEVYSLFDCNRTIGQRHVMTFSFQNHKVILIDHFIVLPTGQAQPNV